MKSAFSGPVSTIFYLVVFRVLALLRLKRWPDVSFWSAVRTLQGAVLAMRRAADQLLPKVTLLLRQVEAADANDWPPLATKRGPLGKLVHREYPFYTSDEWILSRGQLRLYQGALFFFVSVETLLFAFLSPYLLGGAKAMSWQGISTGLFLALAGFFLVHAGLQKVFEAVEALEDYFDHNITWANLVQQIFWGTLGVTMLGLNFVLTWNAAHAREAYFALNKATDPAKSAIYESVFWVILALTLAMPLLLAFFKRKARIAWLLLQFAKKLDGFVKNRSRSLTQAEKLLTLYREKHSAVESATIQLIVHQIAILKPILEENPKARALYAELEQNPRIDEAFFRRHEMVFFLNADLFRFALQRDPQIREIESRTAGLAADIMRLRKLDYRPLPALASKEEKASVAEPKMRLQPNGVHSIWLGLLLLNNLTSCDYVKETVWQTGQNQIVVGVDLSASTGEARASYAEAAAAILRDIRPNYTLTFIAVSGGSQTAGRELFSIAYSEEQDESFRDNTAPQGQGDRIYKKNRGRFIDSLQRQLAERLGTASAGAHANETDVAGGIEVSKGYFRTDNQRNIAVMLSDGLHETASLQMTRNGTQGTFNMNGKIEPKEVMASISPSDFSNHPGATLLFFVGQQSPGYTPLVLNNTVACWQEYAQKAHLIYRGFVSTPTPLVEKIYE